MMDNNQKQVCILGVQLNGQKRLDLALKGISGLGRSKALALAYEVLMIDPYSKENEGKNILELIPILSSLSESQKLRLAQKIESQGLVGDWRAREAKEMKEREQAMAAIKRAKRNTEKADS